MALALSLTLVQAACVEKSAAVPASREPVRVTNGNQPFQFWEGSLARRAADAQCGGKVAVSIYDRFDRTTGAWVYPGGCA